MDKKLEWNKLKSERLKLVRGASFEEITKSKFIEIIKHPSRPDQHVIVYEYKNYIWAVPCIKRNDMIFLKTLYPSRKLLKRYKQEI